MTYALTGKRVVVVGLDIRRPVLAHLCGLNNSSGVTTYLSGQTQDLSSLIHQSQFNPNMYILPAGPVPPNPNELLLNDTAGRMFDTLRRDFDYVIVDSAPIALVSDTQLISPLTDVQIYVTRAGQSTPWHTPISSSTTSTSQARPTSTVATAFTATTRRIRTVTATATRATTARTVTTGKSPGTSDCLAKRPNKLSGSALSLTL